MKRPTLSIIVLVCLVVVLSIAMAFTLVSSASAQLGNSGVPVVCDFYLPLNPIAYPGDCYGADGTHFSLVPPGHYLLVTDILFQPDAPATGYWLFFIYEDIDPASPLQFSTRTQASFAEHFVSPPIVVAQGKSLVAYNSPTSSSFIRVYVSGILTTNYIYAPMVAK